MEKIETIDPYKENLTDLREYYDILESEYIDAVDKYNYLNNDYIELKNSYEELQKDYYSLEQSEHKSTLELESSKTLLIFVVIISIIYIYNIFKQSKNN